MDIKVDNTSSWNRLLLKPVFWYLLISLPIFLWISISSFYYPLGATALNYDYWEHSAAIKEWSRDLISPGNPHLPSSEGSARYMPYFFVLSWLARVFDISPFEALAIGSTVSTFILFCGIYLFFRIYFKNSWASVAGLIILIFGWGTSTWTWSNVYQLKSLFFVIAYPSTFVFALSFFILSLTLKIIREDSWDVYWAYTGLSVFAGIVFLCHPLTAVFIVSSIFLITFFETKSNVRKFLKVTVAVIIGLLLTELWPYFSPWKVIFGTHNTATTTSWLVENTFELDRFEHLTQTHPFYKVNKLFNSLFPILIGIPMFIYLTIKRRHLFLVAGFLLMLAPYLVNLVFEVPLGHRFLIFAVFYLHVAIVAILISLSESFSLIVIKKASLFELLKAVLIIGYLSILIFSNVVNVHNEFKRLKIDDYFSFKQRPLPIFQVMQKIADVLPDNAIVMMPSVYAWPLPSFKGKVVSAFHVNPLVRDIKQRRVDVDRFFQSNTTIEEQKEILDLYFATHIIYRKFRISDSTIKKLNKLGKQIGNVGDFIILKKFHKS